MFNLSKTQTQKQTQTQNIDLTGLDLDDALFSIGVGLKETCKGIAMKLFDQGVSCLDDLRSVSEQDARGILSSAGLNKIQENKIIGDIKGISCQIVEPPKVPEPEGRKCFLMDSSTSVQGDTNYFKNLKEIISGSNDETSIYVQWDSIAQCCSRSQMDDWITSRKGYRATNPINSVPHIPKSFGKNDTIIMVSDGQIDSASAQSFIREMNARFPFGHKFKQIQVILIDTGGPIDKSIVSAFTKYDCQFVLEIYEQNGSLKSQEEENFFKLFGELRDMENLSDFTDKLRKSIHTLALGCSSTDWIVVELRSEIKRLMLKFQEELDRAPPEGNPTLDEFTAETGKQEPSIAVLTESVKKMTSDFHLKKATDGNQLLILIQTESDLTHRLLDFGINSGLHNSGSGVYGLAVANASVAEEVQIDSCAAINEDPCNFEDPVLKNHSFDFEDPISGEFTIASVPIAKGDSLLPSGNISKIRRFPMLFSVSDGILMTPIGLDGFAGMVQHSQSSGLNLSHPLTRAPMRDTVFLIFPEKATDEQKESIVKFNNSAIAKLLFNGKKVGDPNLFYFCFALRMLSVSFLKEFKPQIEEEIRWRLKNSTTCATLCGPSTEFPHDKMSILNALIFTVLSACVCQTSAQNPLLMHISYLSKIKKLLEISGVKLPVEIKKHLELIQVAMKLMAVNKKDQEKNKGKMSLLENRSFVGWKLITIKTEVLSNEQKQPEQNEQEQPEQNEQEQPEQNKKFKVSFYPTGVRLNEDEQLEQNELLKEKLQEIVGFPIKIDLFCSLYDLFINQNDFLTLPHIPFRLQVAVCPRNFTLFKSTDEDFRKAVVDYVKGRKFDRLPSFEHICSKLYITKPTQLLTNEVWDELVASELDTDEKIESFCETYKFVPKFASGGSSYYFSGIPRTQHSTRFGRKTRRRWLNLSKAEQMAKCNGR